MNRKKRFHQSPLQRMEPYLLLIPCFLLFATFTFEPFLKSIYLSMTVTDKKGNAVSWVGIDNFLRLFQKSSFTKVLGNTFLFAALVAVFTFVIAAILAMLCIERRRGTRIYQTLYALPMAIASAPASALFLFVFMQHGILDMLLGVNISWLTSTKYAIYAVAAVTVWLSIGSSFIFLLVGFRAVPEELLESATIDGAGRLVQIFRIIIPISSPQIFFVVFLNITNSFKAFGQIKLLTAGGPANSTETLVYALYKEAILNGRFETACAYAIILFAVIFAVTRVQAMSEKRLVHY